MFQMNSKYMSPGMSSPGPYQQRAQPSVYVHDKLSPSYGSSHGMNGGDMVPLSPADPKPRLRWTPELHERFVDAVTQLGGADSKSTSSYPSIPIFTLIDRQETALRQVLNRACRLLNGPGECSKL